MDTYRVTHYENWYRVCYIDAENESDALAMANLVDTAWLQPEFLDTADAVAEIQRKGAQNDGEY